MKTATSFPYDVEVIENTFLRMRDGTQLAARIWLPKTPDQKPVPAILEYIPYRKRDVTRDRDSYNHYYMAGHGYACVRVDMRGSGDSEGVLLDEYTLQEQEDGVDTIAWIAEQAWCDGSVGMMGISWGGFNSLQVASHRPPALKAVISLCSSDDLYTENMHYMGGCLLGDNFSEATVMLAFNSLPPDPEIVGSRWREMWHERLAGSGLWLESWLSNQRRSDYWTNSSISRNYSAIQCPVFAVGGWADGFTNSVFRMIENLEVPRKGLVGPWGHKYPHQGVPGPAIGFLQEALRWWDYWLKGEDTGIMDEPDMRLWLQDSVPPARSYEQRPGRWISEPSWPSAKITTWRCPVSDGHVELKGSIDDELSSKAVDESLVVKSPLRVGLSAGKWCSYATAPDLPGEQSDDDVGSLVFNSEPLTQSLDVVGAPSMDIELSSDKPQGMVAVRLSDVSPDGQAARVSYGLLNLTHRDSDVNPQPLEPHKRYRVKVKLNNLAHRFPPGHRLRVSVSTSYWPLAWTPPESVQLQVYPLGTHLSLPVRPFKADESVPSFAQPEASAGLGITRLKPSKNNWIKHHDLERKETVLEVINDQGIYKIDETDTQVVQNALERYTFVEGDFTSVRGETFTECGFERADWNVRVKTQSELTCTIETFEIHAQLDAFENGRRVFSETWQRSIPRDNV